MVISKRDTDRSSQEWLTGFVRLHILHHAANEPLVGHWMIEELRRHGYRLSPGTLYPMLRGMEEKVIYVLSESVREGASGASTALLLAVVER
jgi:DNA-binding PadR family transcriptional regulator